jgi:serine/threonine protein kinase
MPTPPFSDQQVVDSFPEYTLATPHLGCGSFKVAYRADHPNGELVIKILTEPLPKDLENVDSDDLPERFARELAGMGVVQSPYVVKLLSPPEIRQIGTSTYVWYAEPYYVGGTLEDALASGAFPPEEVTRIARCLLEAIEEMWNTAQIVHRDIKPGNIVFDDKQNPVLLDLGIAFFANLTAITNAMSPSPRTTIYAAPEQFEIRRNATIDFRTDLFQIGIVTSEMLLGKHPFFQPGDDFDAYYKRLTNFDPSILDSVPGHPELKTFISRCLAERPAGRYRRISQARSALGGQA